MKKLVIDKDKMLEVAETYPEAKKIFKKLWPEEFKMKPIVGEVYQFCGDGYYSGHHYILSKVVSESTGYFMLVNLVNGGCWSDPTRNIDEVFSYSKHKFKFIGMANDILTI